MITRQEHLDWCKKRALEYIDLNDLDQAFASMVSDLGKHPETEEHVEIQLGLMMVVAGVLSDAEQIRNWVNGFN